MASASTQSSSSSSSAAAAAAAVASIEEYDPISSTFIDGNSVTYTPTPIKRKSSAVDDSSMGGIGSVDGEGVQPKKSKKST